MTCSTTERAERTGLVAEWLIAGMRPSQVPAQAAKQGWTVEAGELGWLVADAQSLILADAEVNPELETAKAIDRLNSLYSKSLAIQDYKACMAIQKELNATIARATNPMLRKRTSDGKQARPEAQADRAQNPGRRARRSD